jgi:hypothetical protein
MWGGVRAGAGAGAGACVCEPALLPPPMLALIWTCGGVQALTEVLLGAPSADLAAARRRLGARYAALGRKEDAERLLESAQVMFRVLAAATLPGHPKDDADRAAEAGAKADGEDTGYVGARR